MENETCFNLPLSNKFLFRNCKSIGLSFFLLLYGTLYFNSARHNLFCFLLDSFSNNSWVEGWFHFKCTNIKMPITQKFGKLHYLRITNICCQVYLITLDAYNRVHQLVKLTSFVDPLLNELKTVNTVSIMTLYYYACVCKMKSHDIYWYLDEIKT